MRDPDLERELQAHIELDSEERCEAGASVEDARDAARRELGNVGQIKETVYEMSPFASAERWWKDLRYAARSLLRNPGFASVAVVSLALGIGAATAIFTIADQALLRLLPVEEPARLRLLNRQGEFIGGSSRGWTEAFSYPMFRELEQEKPDSLSGIAARYLSAAAVDAGPGVGRASVELVSGEYFRTLGVGAALGRTFTPEDDEERDAEPWVVTAHAYWRDRLGGDPSIIGKTIRINGFPMTVIGVAQPGFAGFEKLRPADMFVPLQMNAAVNPTFDHRERRDSIWLNIFARLAPAAEAQEAQGALMIPYASVLRRDLAAHSRAADKAERYLHNRLDLVDAAQGLGAARGLVATPLHILLAMTGVLLLITCVNVAALLVIRAAKREREIALRCSLGASRSAVIRLVLFECLLLSAGGAALGLIAAREGAELLVQMIPGGQFGLVFDPSPDWRVAAFAAALGLLTALLFGLSPALRAARSATAPALKEDAASASLGRGHARLRQGLVVAQVALSLTLLAAAGLFGKSLNKLFETNPGIAADRLLWFSINPSEQRYEAARTHQLALDLQRRLALTPGVVSAAAAADPVLAGASGQNSIKVEGHQRQEGEDMQAGDNFTLPEFFSTMGIALLAGRDFNERDALGAPRVVIVNQALADRFFGSPAAALGRRIGSFLDSDPLPFEIVGVVADHKATDLKEDGWPRTYRPLLQLSSPSHIAFYVRARGEPDALAAAAQAVVREIDPELPVFNIRTVRRQIEETHFIERLFGRLSAAFAVLATLIAAVGLYGVSAYSVARRTREIGVRMALGAERGGVFRLVLWEALGLAAVGLLIGAPASWALGKLVEAQLYGVAAVDLGVSIAAVGALLTASAFAGYLPARRAMRISPVSALRHE